MPLKSCRRHRPSITIPKHYIPAGIGHWGQAELETDATKQRQQQTRTRRTFGVQLHYIIPLGSLCFELDILPCLAARCQGIAAHTDAAHLQFDITQYHLYASRYRNFIKGYLVLRLYSRMTCSSSVNHLNTVQHLGHLHCLRLLLQL